MLLVLDYQRRLVVELEGIYLCGSRDSVTRKKATEFSEEIGASANDTTNASMDSTLSVRQQPISIQTRAE